MNWKVAGIALVVGGALVGGYLVFRKGHSGPPVTATIRVNVAPKEQLDFVADKANSALFKYLIGKKTGVKPALAQKLEAKAVPNSSLLEAKVGVLATDEGQRYAAAFLEVLQDLCGKEAQLSLEGQSVR
jgi:hypothetical protein